jgi:hypothetical protein
MDESWPPRLGVRDGVRFEGRAWAVSGFGHGGVHGDLVVSHGPGPGVMEDGIGVVMIKPCPEVSLSRSSCRQVCIHRSATEFMRGTWMPVVMTLSPASASTASKAFVNFA